MRNCFPRIVSLISLLLLSNLSQAAVSDWGFVKGIGGVMAADNQQPPVTSWDIEVFVVTGAAGEATSVSISGGGIDGSLAFELEGSEWIYEQNFASEAAMDAVFPNNASYTITLSGGTLGTLTQTVTVGAATYPNLPYFTGNVYSSLQNFDPTASFDFVFATPSEEADLTAFDLEVSGGDFVFETELAGSETTITLPANTLESGESYEGFIDHASELSQSGTGGFGVDGSVYFTAYSRFDVDTNSSGSIIGAWEYGDTTSEGSGVVVLMKDGTYYHVEDVSVADGDPDGFERGTYTWNETTGAFSATPLQDTNGETGLSHPEGSTTVSVSGDSLTYSDSEGSTVLSRVFDANNPLVGGWQFGEGRAQGSRVLVFLSNGVYFGAQTTDPQISPDGMEKGTYTWNAETGAFEATVQIDTNGSVGFSHPMEGFSIGITNDEMLIYDGDSEWRLYLVSPDTPGMPVPAVTHWRFLKSRDHFQSLNNTAPPVSTWSVYVVVETKLNLDASAGEVRGVGIEGSYPLTQVGREWSLEMDFNSEAEMNAAFPAGTEITIELSGGNLGTISQSFTLMGDQYPNTPYLTGTKFTDAQSFDSFTDFGLTWSNPGGLTESTGQTILEIYREYDDDEVYRESVSGANTVGVVPAGTVDPGHTFYGYLEYTHARIVDGAGGFGIAGTESRNVATDFTLATPDSPLAGAWSFGDASGEDSGVLVFLNNGTYFHIEDVAAADPDPDGFERGNYEWDRDSGAFSVETIVDTNGSVGLSDFGDILSLVVAGDSLTFTDDGDVSVLSRVVSESDDLVGGWQWGGGNEEFGGAYVFLDSGYYFGLEYTQPIGQSLEGGVERGSYTFDDLTLIANALMDTNGEDGLSHVDGEWAGNVFDDRFGFGDNRGGESLFSASKSDIENRVSIYDSNLLTAFRNTTGKQTGPILRIDLQRILKMNASGLGIEDLHGFEEATNMRELDLSHNALTDIWQIGNMQELRFLDLSHNQISSLSDLGLLERLVSLDVSSNLLNDEEPSSDLREKDEIGAFAATGILAPLETITTLDTLKFANNGIRDLDVLSTLPRLKVVDISGNQVVDLSPLSQLTKLERILLYDNPIDLSEGSGQRELLDTIETNTGAVVVLVALDPFATYLSWQWNAERERYELLWTEQGTLQSSSDLEIWEDEESAESPYPVDGDEEVETPRYWKLDL